MKQIRRIGSRINSPLKGLVMSTSWKHKEHQVNIQHLLRIRWFTLTT